MDDEVIAQRCHIFRKIKIYEIRVAFEPQYKSKLIIKKNTNYVDIVNVSESHKLQGKILIYINTFTNLKCIFNCWEQKGCIYNLFVVETSASGNFVNKKFTIAVKK